MYTLIHQTHGRMRVRLHALKGNVSEATGLLKSLKSLPGITRVVANDITGSVVVYFDPTKLCSSDILKAFRRAGHLPNIIGFPQARLKSRGRKAPASKGRGLMYNALFSGALVVAVLDLLLKPTELLQKV